VSFAYKDGEREIIPALKHIIREEDGELKHIIREEDEKPGDNSFHHPLL